MFTMRFQTTFYIAILLGVLALAFFVFKPYLTPLFLAFVLYVISKPVYKGTLTVCRGTRWLASAVTLLLIIVLVFIPFIVFGSLLFDDARDLYIRIASGDGVAASLDSIEKTIGTYLSALVPGFSFDIESYVAQAAAWLVDNIGAFFSGFMRFIVGFAIMLLALFYFFKDGDSFKQKLLLYSPLDDNYDRDIFNHIEKAINSVVLGSLLVALVQGLFIAVGFWFTGIPNPVIWGSVGVVAALIQSFGTSLVLIPGILFLLSTGHPIASLVLLVWGMGVVGVIDNILRPLLLTRSISIHPLLILLSVIGGIGFFGLVGFIAGPVILSLLFVLINLYPHVVGTGNSKA